MGSGIYLGVAGQSASSGANVEQSNVGTLWQVLPDDTGSYYLVPKCSSTSAMDLYTGVIKKGQNIGTWNYNLRKSQRWALSEIKAKPVISGKTVPTTMTQGSSFSIRGTISSGDPISSVTVGVYDTNGKMKIGKTVSPNTTSYNLKNIDTNIKFGSLAASGYRYKVTAVLLWTKSNVAYRKFQFVYQGNGYYKIKNVGSGLYLGVANNGSKAGSNVQLSSSATLWQVLPDGTGAYYLVPNCSSTCTLDLYTGILGKGKNIDIWSYNLGKAQRWKLQ